MPKVTLTYNPEFGKYHVDPYTGGEIDKEYQVVVDMKSSHYRNIIRNRERYWKDQDFMRDFFMDAQQAGRPIRER